MRDGTANTVRCSFPSGGKPIYGQAVSPIEFELKQV
jgi:hypothetical protein